MGTTTVEAAPDYAAITARQQTAWATGDYSVVAARIQVISELLCDAADLRAGSRVLDVAGGSGNTALAAARTGARVVSLDYVPSLLERARARAAAEGLAVETVEGDAQALPFPDRAFDAVVSVLGAMFAPDQRRTAAEMMRVCRGGRDDRAGQLDARGLHRPALPDRRRTRAAAGGADAAAALGRRGPRAGAVRRRRPRPPRPPARVHVAVHLAGGVRRPVPRVLRPDGRRVRRRWSPRDGTRWRPTSPRWPVASTATAEAARSRSRPSTWRSWRRAPRPGPGSPRSGSSSSGSRRPTSAPRSAAPRISAP